MNTAHKEVWFESPGKPDRKVEDKFGRIEAEDYAHQMNVIHGCDAEGATRYYVKEVD